jgi:transcriptional regulator with XRE-family HTH domain
MTEARSFRELVAERVQRRRRELGWTQDQLAREVWRRGRPSVTRAVIAGIERATADLTIPEMATLLKALETNLDELLESGGEVFIDQGVSIEVDELLRQLDGRGTPWHPKNDSTARIVFGRNGVVAGYVQRPIGPEEVKAGLHLGVTPEEVARAAGSLWGCSLAEEREARLVARAPQGASARSLQAMRGHITRALLAELLPVLQPRVPAKRGKGR